MVRFQSIYREKIVPDLMKKFGYTSVMQVPRITKITLNMGVGDAVNDKKNIDMAVGDMTKIAGQKPVVTKARKAVANFKIREGLAIGCMVTLRGTRMYEFLDRLVSLAIPRVKDFRGLDPKAFDRSGNYNFGFTEQTVFPEVNGAEVTAQQGMNITMVIKSGDAEHGRELLKQFGMPFRQDEKQDKR